MNRNRIVHATRVTLAITGLSLLFTWLIPTLAGERVDSRSDLATNTCRRIAAALAQYRSDTGLRPNGPLGDASFVWLRGSGELPTGNSLESGTAGSLDAFLVVGGAALAGDGWAGPYIRPVEADPWGRAYVVGVSALSRDGARTWVLSAGPDGVVETAPGDDVPMGDDLGATVR